MWPTIIQAAALIAAAVLAKTFLVSPESRHVHRIQAYLDIRSKLGEDKALIAHVNALIIRAINAEVRA